MTLPNAAKALADELYYNTPKEKLTEKEFASGIYVDIYDGKYYSGGPKEYEPNHSFAGDIRREDCVASFHSHTVQQSLCFSGEDMPTLFRIYNNKLDHVEYLFHKDNDTNLYTLIRYDKSKVPGYKSSYTTIKVYGE